MGTALRRVLRRGAGARVITRRRNARCVSDRRRSHRHLRRGRRRCSPVHVRRSARHPAAAAARPDGGADGGALRTTAGGVKRARLLPRAARASASLAAEGRPRRERAAGHGLLRRRRAGGVAPRDNVGRARRTCERCLREQRLDDALRRARWRRRCGRVGHRRRRGTPLQRTEARARVRRARNGARGTALAAGCRHSPAATMQ